MTTASNERIKLMYEQGMTAQQIADDEGIDVSLIKGVLKQCCAKFRHDLANEKEDITDVEYESILCTYKELALTCDNEGVKERALRFLIQEKKGRNDSRTQASINVGQLNLNQLALCFEASKKAKLKIKGINGSNTKKLEEAIEV